jgi:hypothetical protein
MSEAERGQIVTDLLVASTLVVSLVGICLLFLGVIETGFSVTSARTTAETSARQILDGLARAIGAARPLGWCPDGPPGREYETTAPACLHVSTYSGWPPDAPIPGGPIVYADASVIWFWDDTASDFTVPLAIPDCVAVQARNDVLTVSTWRGAGTFTTTTCPGVQFNRVGPPSITSSAAETRYIGALGASSAPVFMVTDGAGQPTAAPDAMALLTITAVFRVPGGVTAASAQTFQVQVATAIRGTIYRREESWNAT